MGKNELQRLCRLLDNTLAKQPDLTALQACVVMEEVLTALEEDYASVTNGATPY